MAFHRFTLPFTRSTLAFFLIALTLGSARLAAADAAELLVVAEQLHDEYEALQARVDDCPGGQCEEKQDILDDLGGTEDERRQLHLDRAALGSCACQALDAVIDSVDDLATTVLTATLGWEETLPDSPEAGAGPLALPVAPESGGLPGPAAAKAPDLPASPAGRRALSRPASPGRS
jgi:hypothetical protein